MWVDILRFAFSLVVFDPVSLARVDVYLHFQKCGADIHDPFLQWC